MLLFDYNISFLTRESIFFHVENVTSVDTDVKGALSDRPTNGSLFCLRRKKKVVNIN
jgi:hypothetical protein